MAGILDAIAKAIAENTKNFVSSKVPEKVGGKDYEIAPNPYQDKPWWLQASYTDDPVMDTVRETAEEAREESDARQQAASSVVTPTEAAEEETGLFGSATANSPYKPMGSRELGTQDEGDEQAEKDGFNPFERPIPIGSRTSSGATQQEDAGGGQQGNANQEALRARMDGDVSSDEEGDEEPKEDEADGVDPSKFYKDGVFDYDAYQNELIKNMYDMDMFTFAYTATPKQYYELASDDMLSDLYAKELGVDELTLDAMTDWVNAERAARSVDDVVNAVQGGDFGYLTDSYGTAENSNLYNSILDYAASRGVGVYIPEGTEFSADSLYALDGRSEEDQASALRNALGMEFLAWALLNDDQGMYATMTPEDVNAYTQAEGIEYGQAGQDGYAEATGDLPADWAFDPDYAMESYGQGWGYSGNRNMRDLIYDRLGYGWRTRQ